MRKTVLTIDMDGFRLSCVRIGGQGGRYHLYRVSSGHRMQILVRDDIISILGFIRDLYTVGADTFDSYRLRSFAANYDPGDLWRSLHPDD